MRFTFVSVLSQRGLVLVTSGNGGIRRQNGDGGFIRKQLVSYPRKPARQGSRLCAPGVNGWWGLRRPEKWAYNAGSQKQGTLGPPQEGFQDAPERWFAWWYSRFPLGIDKCGLVWLPSWLPALGLQVSPHLGNLCSVEYCILDGLKF